MSHIPDSGASAVYTGFWVDHNEGRFLTLSNRDAAALLSFLAVAVTFAGNRSWKIWRFAIYQGFLCNHGQSENTTPLDRRLQVILRNVITAGSTVWSIIEMLWFRESKSQTLKKVQPRWKSMVLALFSVIHMAAFIAAGILSSRILVGRTVVSKEIDSCGIWSTTAVGDPDQRYLWSELRLNNTLDADNYVRNCYGMGVSRGILDCGKLFTPSLSYHVEHDASCPFNSEICTIPNATFAMDSGWISFHDLGINSEFAKSMSVQRRSVCTVIPDSPFLTAVYTPQDMPTVLSDKQRIHEYDFDTNPSIFWWYRNQNSSRTYDLKTVPLLIPSERVELLRSDSQDYDLNLILLHSNGIPFLNTHDDPWFSVHTPMDFNNSTGLIPTNYTRYETDRFLNIIACEERSRFCSTTTQTCSPWTGLFNTSMTPSPALAGTIKNGTKNYFKLSQIIGLVSMVMHSTAILDSIQDRPVGSALQASRYLELGEQTRLAPAQWKLELEYWFAMAMARLQLEIFNTIEKPPGVDARRAVNLWEGKSLKNLCGRIKFHSPNHSTLSAVGVVVVVVLVGMLTLVSYVDVFLGWIPAGWARGVVGEWDCMENLSLVEVVEGWEGRVEIMNMNDPLEVRWEGGK